MNREMTFLSPSPTRLGIVCLARMTFEAELAAQWYRQAQTPLSALDGVTLCAVAPLVVEPHDAADAIAELRVSNIDALVIVNGTFALGGLALQFAQAFDVPLLLWAWPEPTEQTGKLRLNSLVGAHLNASNLFKLGRRTQTLYAPADDATAVRAIAHFARVAGIARDLRQLRIGLIGGHAPGFDNLAVNKLALRQSLGVEVVDVSLQTVIAKAQAINAQTPASARDEALSLFDDRREVTATQGELFTSLIGALQTLVTEQRFDALALKCWGDIAEQYGIAACGAVSVLNNLGIVVGCEGDVMGALTMLVAQRLCGAPAFLSDIVAIERADNTGLFWHIGCAPLCLADARSPKQLFSHFAGGKGVTAGFALKPGRMTILRFGDDGQQVRALATTSEALESEMNIRGTVARVRFDANAGALLDELLNNGWEHHLVLAYGDIVDELRLLCRELNIQMTVISSQ